MSSRFAFGKNWKYFVEKHFSPQALETAQQNLCSFLLPAGLAPSLHGLSFLDIGCGSGLHSLAAFRAGAEQVVSFDFDPDSVNAAKQLHQYAGSPSNWQILQGDVLNKDFVRSLGSFDIVYSWGVLHHTGNMQAAIANATLPLSRDGLLFLALYSYTAYQNGIALEQPSPEEWLDIKQRYLGAGIWQQRFMRLQYLWGRYFRPAHGNPRRLILGAEELYRRWKQYGKQSRGMHFFTDIHDWLGGWPMDFVHEGELVKNMKEELKMNCLRMQTGRGNSEFLFRPQNAVNIWDKALAEREIHLLKGPFVHYAGPVWSAKLDEAVDIFDSENVHNSPLRLLEDGDWLPFAHCHLPGLIRFGAGRYRHTGSKEILFSTSDNSDPNSNGKTYSWFVDRR